MDYKKQKAFISMKAFSLESFKEFYTFFTFTALTPFLPSTT